MFLSLWAGFCILLGAAFGRYAESPLLILIALAIISLLVFLAMDVAFYLMLICLPFSFRYILSRGMEVQTPTEPLLGMLVFAFLLKQVINQVIRREEISQTQTPFPFTVPLVFYICATFLSIFNTPQLFVSIKGAIRTVVYMMSGFLVYELIRSRRAVYNLFVSTFPAAAIAVVWTIVVLIYHIDLWQWREAYQGTPFTNYSVYGSFTAVFFLIVFSRLLLDNTLYDRVLYTGLLIIFGFGLIMCFSRGVWLSVIVAVGFLLMQLGTGEGHKKILFIGFVGIFILVIFSLPGVSELVLYRISSAFSLEFASNKARLLRWGQAFIMFLQHPIIGNGYGAFAMLYEENVSLVGAYTAQFRLGAHSEYLQVLAELGIVGFVAWMWLIIAFFRYGLRSLRGMGDEFYRSLIVGLMGAELSLLVHFTVNNLMNGDAIGVPFWLIYGLVPAIVQIANEEKSVQEIGN